MANRIKIWIIAIALFLLVVPTAFGACVGDCKPTIFGYAIRPCNAYDVNRSSPIRVEIAATSCDPDHLPQVTCDVGYNWLRVDFWKLDMMIRTDMPPGWEEDAEAIQDCTEFHYANYCDNVSAMVTVYYGNTTYESSTNWSALDWGYMGQVGVEKKLITFDTDDLAPGWNWTGVAQIEIKVKSINETWDADVKTFNFTIKDAQANHYGKCVLSSVEPPGYVLEDNRWSNTARSFGIFGPGVMYTLFVLIVCGAIFMAVGTKNRGKDINLALGMTLAIGLLLITIGAYLRLIGWLPIAIFLIVVAVTIVSKVRKMFVG